MFDNKTVLVTGGAGFIGSNLCDVLIKNDLKKLIIFDNLCQSTTDNIKHLLENPRVEFVRGDVRDYEVVRECVLESDYVFHLAASNMGTSENRPRVDMETNIIGTFNVLTAAKEKPEIRIVHASSGSVIGSSDVPMPEDSTPHPTTPYAISKLSGEKYAQFFAEEFGVKVSIVRYHHVFGPRQDPTGKSGVINIFLSKILKGETPCIWGNGEQIKCFTFVLDTVDATIMVSQKDETIGEVYNVVSETRMNINELADLFIKKYAEDKSMTPTRGPAKVGENIKPNPSPEKIKKLGFKASRNFEEGIELSKQWVESIIK